jgi:hypothetical protein
MTTRTARWITALRNPPGQSRRAQALVEFAIVVPVMVTCLLFSMYFYEVIQVKLKVQEVARYAAWEFTAYPLHNYKDGKFGYSDAKSAIQTDIGSRYKDLKSATEGNGNAWMMIEWQAPRVRFRDADEPKLPGGAGVNMAFTALGYIIDFARMASFSTGNPVYMLLQAGYMGEQANFFGGALNRFNPPSRWKFNKKGYVGAMVTLKWRNLLVPKYFMEGSSGWYKDAGGAAVKHFSGTKTTFTGGNDFDKPDGGAEVVNLLADSWRLDQGDDIEGTQHKDRAFFKQVDRMAFVSPAIKNGIKTLVVTPLQIAAGVLALVATQPPLTMDPMETALVSKNYKDQNPASGTVTLQEDKDRVSYDTAPLAPNSQYLETLKKRGASFMGCREPEKLGCFDSLSSENPFASGQPETP